MSNHSLRVFPSNVSNDDPQSSSTASDRRDRELDRITGIADPRTVSLSLGQIIPLLMDASQQNRAWISDFADDTVQIDSDLYQVLLAYQQQLDASPVNLPPVSSRAA